MKRIILMIVLAGCMTKEGGKTSDTRETSVPVNAKNISGTTTNEDIEHPNGITATREIHSPISSTNVTNIFEAVINEDIEHPNGITVTREIHSPISSTNMTNIFEAVVDENIELLEELFVKKPSILNEQNEKGQTAMHIAIINKKQKVFNFLLTKDNLDLKVVDKEGKRPFFYVTHDMSQQSSNNHLYNYELKVYNKVVDIIEKDDLNSFIKFMSDRGTGFENLYVPIKCNNSQLISIFIAEGANNIVGYLLEKETAFAQNVNLLHIFNEKLSLENGKNILNKAKDVNKVNNGRLLLYGVQAMVKENRTQDFDEKVHELVKLVLENYNVEPSCQSRLVNILVKEKGSQKDINLFLQRDDLNLKVKDVENKTVFDYAEGRKDILQMLEEYTNNRGQSSWIEI